MRQLLRLLTFCLLITSLSSCSGWHLRGGEVDPAVISRFFLSVDNVAVEKSFVYRELSVSLRHEKKLMPRQQADIQLILGEPVFNRRTISVDSNLRTAEFQLTLKAPYKLLGQQRTILYRNTALLTRSYRFNEQDIVSKNKEEKMIKKEMAKDIARQILRQARTYLMFQHQQSTGDQSNK